MVNVTLSLSFEVHIVTAESEMILPPETVSAVLQLLYSSLRLKTVTVFSAEAVSKVQSVTERVTAERYPFCPADTQ